MKHFFNGSAVAAVCMMTLLSAGQAKAQEAVFDASTFAETLSSAETAVTQLNQLKQTYATEQSQLTALTGSRGLETLLSSASTTDEMPANMSEAYSGLTSGNYAGITSEANSLLSSNAISSAGSDLDTSILAQKESDAATNKAMDLQAYNMEQQRTDNITTELDDVDQTPDLKASVDLSNRIALETQRVANEHAKIELMDNLQNDQNAETAAQQDQENSTIWDTSVTATPSLANVTGY